MQSQIKVIKMPIQFNSRDAIIVTVVLALEVIILTALAKNYEVEVSGETTEQGVKGSLKLQPY
jgi:hypothetical protein